MGNFKHTSVEDQMKVFNLTKKQAEEKIKLYRERLKKRKHGHKKYNQYSIEDQIRIFNLSKEQAEEKIKNLKSLTNPTGKTTKEYWIKKGMNESSAILKAKSYKESITTGHLTSNVEWQMKRFNLTKEQAKQKIKTAFQKRRDSYIKLKETDPERFKAIRPTDKAHWLRKGYSLEDAIKKAIEYQENMRSVFQTNIKEFPDMYKGRTQTELKYWVNKGFPLKEAIEKHKERQRTFTKEKCIAKYGKDEGLKIWKERQDKWKTKLYEHFIKEGDGRSPSSTFANNIIKELCNYLKIEKPKNEKFISSKNKEECYSYDFTYNKKIIEFNGDYWHFNPNIYEATHYDKRTKKTAQEKWDYDKKKIKLAEYYGYEVKIVWESDYNKNPATIISECIQFLNK